MADFLFEIGLEEVPARMIAAAQAELQKRTAALLEREHLLAAGATAVSYSTPRRLAVLVKGVLEQQPDITEETTGPAVKIAFKDGVPTPAAEAFARKSGVAVSDLRTIETPKGEYLAATSVKKGRSASAVIADELPKELAGIYWAKNMRWIPGSNEKFVRPIVWMVCVLGEAVVPVSFGGKTAGRASFGHRVLSSGEPFEVQLPESYLAQLEGEYVLADVEVRRQKIRKALDHVTRTVAGARWREDEPLVDAVTHLTEWPDVLLGNFEADYLKLPEEVLVTVMRDHQKYFAVEDASGKLAPHFLTVTNIELGEENAPIIRQGNERVLRARFNDAKFFWEFDQRTPLVDRVKLLENVTFQKDLGSYAKKSERVRSLAAKLASVATSRGATLDVAAIDEAATLAKTDLTTELVKEFTELQGAIGGLYAASQGVNATVADAIYDQYLPASAKDEIPRSAEGIVLGLADRVDTITGMFGLGMEPTGSKDPFALRRAANSIVRLLSESSLNLKVSDVLAVGDLKPETAAKLQAFFSERIDFYLREGCDQAYDVVKAAVAAGSDDLRDLVARAEAVTAVRGSEDFLAVSAAFKRMKNILTQAAEKGIAIPSAVDVSVLAEPTEIALAARSAEVATGVEILRAAGDYRTALEAISTLRPQVDAFFEAVMVMAPDEAVRKNRLALLQRITRDFSRIADFSEIVSS
ncbi:glycine--tRNA ligase subunit beta [Granulicella paludicola]|uniref:glycine--tRNA ligase subunit beta n=1 Tax=Granulicella paludicola TaxID=474951 RepID=UPI0021E0AFE5|nr:glycine--tRNA ligase subunit beta [Granulicella paludicola]